MSTRLEAGANLELLRTLTTAARARAVLTQASPPDVEGVRRRGAQHDYLFVLNHGADPVDVTVTAHDLRHSTARPASGLRVVPVTRSA